MNTFKRYNTETNFMLHLDVQRLDILAIFFVSLDTMLFFCNSMPYFYEMGDLREAQHASRCSALFGIYHLPSSYDFRSSLEHNTVHLTFSCKFPIFLHTILFHSFTRHLIEYNVEEIFVWLSTALSG